LVCGRLRYRSSPLSILKYILQSTNGEIKGKYVLESYEKKEIFLFLIRNKKISFFQKLKFEIFLFYDNVY